MTTLAIHGAVSFRKRRILAIEPVQFPVTTVPYDHGGARDRAALTALLIEHREHPDLSIRFCATELDWEEDRVRVALREVGRIGLRQAARDAGFEPSLVTQSLLSFVGGLAPMHLYFG